MLPRKKVLLQEKFPSCRRTFFRSNRWNNLLPWHTTEEPSSEELGGRTFFHETRWKKLLPRDPTEEPSSTGVKDVSCPSRGRCSSSGSRGRTFFRWFQRKNHLSLERHEATFTRERNARSRGKRFIFSLAQQAIHECCLT